ncbi:MAG: DinB family protein [Chloroflexia bacterium]
METPVNRMIQLLQTSLGETLSLLAALTEDDLDRPCDHPCAMGGTVRDLLTHNIDHERMHSGQIYSARYSLQRMQKGEVHRPDGGDVARPRRPDRLPDRPTGRPTRRAGP